MMKKRIGPFLSFLAILLLGIGVFYISFSILKETMFKETKIDGYRLILIQDEEKKGEADPHMIQILKEVQKKLDEWLKSLNDRIESEDVTRFEVRFLEILRNILEWIKDKVDAKIESFEGEKPKGRGKKGILQEIRQRNLLFFKIG
jgi:hypothetical protein